MEIIPVQIFVAVLTEECGPVTSSVVKFAVDSLLEGSGFELPVPRCALIANSAALVAPPDSPGVAAP